MDVAGFLGFREPAYSIQEFRRRFGSLPDDYQRRFGAVRAAWEPRICLESEPVRSALLLPCSRNLR